MPCTHRYCQVCYRLPGWSCTPICDAGSPTAQRGWRGQFPPSQWHDWASQRGCPIDPRHCQWSV